jgi:hypothetical protein
MPPGEFWALPMGNSEPMRDQVGDQIGYGQRRRQRRRLQGGDMVDFRIMAGRK